MEAGWSVGCCRAQRVPSQVHVSPLSTTSCRRSTSYADEAIGLNAGVNGVWRGLQADPFHAWVCQT